MGISLRPLGGDILRTCDQSMGLTAANASPGQNCRLSPIWPPFTAPHLVVKTGRSFSNFAAPKNDRLQGRPPAADLAALSWQADALTFRRCFTPGMDEHGIGQALTPHLDCAHRGIELGDLDRREAHRRGAVVLQHEAARLPFQLHLRSATPPERRPRPAPCGALIADCAGLS